MTHIDVNEYTFGIHSGGIPQPVSNFVDVGPGYFSTMGIPIVRGREFTTEDATLDPRSIIVNEALARREYPNEDPIGHRISFGPDQQGNQQWLDIVGVVGNVRQYRADQEPVPIIYAPNSGQPSRAQNLLIRTSGDPMSVAGPVRAALQVEEIGGAHESAVVASL